MPFPFVTSFFVSCFRSLQQRIPNETLSGLATTVAEGPIFEIVDGLKEVQQAVEKKCFRERLDLLRRQAGPVDV